MNKSNFVSTPTDMAKNEKIADVRNSGKKPPGVTRSLPAPKTGVVVTVPLSVLPDYMEFFHLASVRYGWSDLAEDDVLFVRYKNKKAG